LHKKKPIKRGLRERRAIVKKKVRTRGNSKKKRKKMNVNLQKQQNPQDQTANDVVAAGEARARRNGSRIAAKVAGDRQ